MSLAKKCDVCGNLYEGYGVKLHDGNSRAVNGIILVHVDEEGMYGTPDDATDCCPLCMEKILKLLKELGLQ